MFRTTMVAIALCCATNFPISAIAATAVVDAASRPVPRAATAPRRIVVGSGPLMHAVMAIEGSAGQADRGTSRIIAVGADFKGRDKAGAALLTARYPAIATMASTAFGDMPGLDAAAVITLKPDLAILSGTDDEPKAGSLAEALIAAGVPVVLTDFRSHPGPNSLTSLRAIATALGHDADGNGFVRFYRDQMARITDVTGPLAPADRPRVFFDMRAEAGKGCCGTPGKGNYGELIEAAGAVNVGGEIHGAPLGKADVAAVLAAKPDLYVAGSSNGAGVPLGRGVRAEAAATALTTLTAGRSELAALPALSNGRAFAAWHSFYNHPFNVAVVQAMARHFHPDRFATVDPAATLTAAYAFVGIEPDGTYWTTTTATPATAR